MKLLIFFFTIIIQMNAKDLTLFCCVLSTCFSGTKLSEDCRKYGVENTCTSGNTLSKAALNYGRARAQIEKERGNLLKALGTQVWPISLFSKM